MKSIKQDTIHREQIFPKPQDAASAMGNHGVDVVGTPALILYFEAAANNLAMPYYENGEISVGTHVCIDHLAPAFAGESVYVTAKLTLHKGRRLEFWLTARQGETLVMSGVHHRAVLPREQFSGAQKVQHSKKKIDFWFDFHSPWCYFASHRIGEIAQRSGAMMSWKPVHLSNLNEAVDGRKPLQANTRFVTWYEQDQWDTAAMCGLPFEPHKEYPKRPSRALRAAIFAQENGVAEPFVKAVMRGYWAEQKDLSDMQWLGDVADSVGLDRAAITKSMTAESYKQQLNQNLDQAIAQNLFGLPAAVVDDKIFWGNDRLELLAHHLSGQPPELQRLS